MKYLNDFLNKIAITRYLWYSDEFQIFVRSSNPDIEKVININNYRLLLLFQRLLTKKSLISINQPLKSFLAKR